MSEWDVGTFFERLMALYFLRDYPVRSLHNNIIAQQKELETITNITLPFLDTFTNANSFEMTWGLYFLLGLLLLQFLVSLRGVRNLIVEEGSVEEDLLKRIFRRLLAITTIMSLGWSLDSILDLWDLQQQPYIATLFQALFRKDLCLDVTVELVFTGFFFLGLLSHLTLHRFEEKHLPLWSLLWVRSLVVFIPLLFIILCIKNLAISYLLFQVYIGWVYNLNGFFDWMGLKSDLQEFYYQGKVPAFRYYSFEYLFLLSFSLAVFFFGYLFYYYGVHTYDQGLHVSLPEDEKIFLGKFLILNMCITTLVIPLCITLRFFGKIFLPTIYFLVLGPVQVGSLIIFCFTTYLLNFESLISLVVLFYTSSFFWGVCTVWEHRLDDPRISILTIGLLGQWAVMLFLVYVGGFGFGWSFLFFCFVRFVLVYMGTLYYWQHHLYTLPSIDLLLSYLYLWERSAISVYLTLYMLIFKRFMLFNQPLFSSLKLLIAIVSDYFLLPPWFAFCIYLLIIIIDLCFMYFGFLTALFFLEDKFYKRKFRFKVFGFFQLFLLLWFLFSVFPT